MGGGPVKTYLPLVRHEPATGGLGGFVYRGAIEGASKCIVWTSHRTYLTWTAAHKCATRKARDMRRADRARTVSP